MLKHCIIAIGCVLLAILLVISVAGCKKKSSVDLVIISPHNKKIQTEFENAFRKWYKSRFGEDVKIEWRDVGGTTSITRFLLSQYTRADSSGIDLYFGGGAPDHKFLADNGITVRAVLPPQLLEKIPAVIGGIRQYDPAGRWYGAAMSCFGIIYNAKLLRANNLPIPRTWDDLASPAMYNRIAAADATQSGSARAAYEMIVQSSPSWQAGWEKLLKIFGNCKRFTSSASDIPTDVANGEILAGAAIDFYAYDQIAVSGKDLGFTIVRGATAFTPDPISMLRGAPHAQIANRFIEFVLSEQGQCLWCLPPCEPMGPERYALYRQPVRRDVYEKYADKMLKPLVNPFTYSGDFKFDESKAAIRISRLWAPLMKAAAIDSAAQLHKAWKVIIDSGQPADLLEEFSRLPDDLADEQTALKTAEKLTDPKQRELITSKWQRFFRDKYNRIISRQGK